MLYPIRFDLVIQPSMVVHIRNPSIQKDPEFEANLGYIVIPYLKKKKRC
jgi:hypothetical protein